MNDLQGKHIVLGMTGGIAAYKAAELCRALIKEGATVQVVMTAGAEQFITPVTMQALSGHTVYTSQWDAREPNNMPHINLSREADAILIAPASADFMAKLLHGQADDLLSLMCLARPRADSVQGAAKPVPLLIAPAMNREMWSHPATQRNMAQLAADGAHLLGVGSGDQACGETGDGRMLEPQECWRM
jgi:phosphopantothenoylcysteine decarboxylase / phosphopantothenate---cysteine ligase